jgi:hypothetical protein
MRENQIVPNKRTKWIWAISIFYFFSAAYTLLSFYLIHSGAIAVPNATQRYLESLTALDYAFSILVGLANLTGAISLFLLRKVAYPLFLGSFIANILMTIWHALTKNLLAAFVSGSAIGMIIGWVMIVAVCVYTKKLSKAGVLH